jgi:hypothetical protein
LSLEVPYFFTLRMTRNMITAIIAATINTPVQTPALNIPPTTAQLLQVSIISASESIAWILFMSFILGL